MIKEFNVEVTARIPTEQYAYVEISASVTAQVADGETLEQAKQEAEEHLARLLKTQAEATLTTVNINVFDLWVKRLRLHTGTVQPNPVPTPPSPNTYGNRKDKEQLTRLGSNATRKLATPDDDWQDGHPNDYGDK